MGLKKRGFELVLVLLLITILSFSVSAVTSITSCKYSIDSQGEYNLTQDITSSGKPCINITASNVSLNCEGHSLTGAYMNPGIRLDSSVSNITIKGCQIDAFAPDISGQKNKEVYIINNTINASPSYGLYLLAINNSKIENNSIFDNGDETNEAGIYMYTGYDNLIKNNSIFSNGDDDESVYGISLIYNHRTNITDNFLFNNSDMGIESESSPNTLIKNNIIENNSRSNDDIMGIYIVLSADNTSIINNTIRNHNYGIYMNYADNINITDNTVHNHTYGGIIANDGENVLMKNNIVYNNSNGLGLVTCTEANITNNTIKDETYGLIIQTNSENSSIYSNKIKGCSEGIIFYSTARYNTVRFNNLSNDIDFILQSSIGNKFFDNDVNPYTQFSFTEYSGDLNVSGVTTPPATSPYRNISRYLNITGNDWVIMNISYANADISAVEENSIKMLHYSNSAWNVLNSSQDKNNRDISANISSFSIFALLANPDCGTINEDLTLLSNVSTSASCFIINKSNIKINCNNNNITGTKATNSRGIHLNYTQNVSVHNCNIFNFTSGIYLYTSHNSSITNNTVGYNSNGLDTENYSSENIFINNNASYSSNCDIHLESGYHNKFFNITISPVKTIIGFNKYNGSVHLKSIENPYADLSGKKNVSSYVNITKTDGDYIELNISYSDTVVSDNNIDESTLKVYHYTNNDWTELTSTLDSTNNILFANITSFSPFGIFGDENAQTASTSGGGGGGGGYSNTIVNAKSYNISDVFIPKKSILTEQLRKNDYVQFNYKNNNHKITIKDIIYSNKAVRIEVASVPKIYLVYLNQKINVDIDNNGYNDLLISPYSVSLGYSVLNITVLDENLPKPTVLTEKTDIVSKPNQENIDETNPVQTKVTELVKDTSPQIYDSKNTRFPIIAGIFAVIIIIAVLVILFFRAEKGKTSMPVKRISITKKIPDIKKPYVVPIKKTSFVPGLLESFKKLKKKKIIQEIISSKKTPEKVSFAQPIEEVLKEKEQEIEKKTIKKQKIKTEKKKKQNPKKKKTVQKKKSKKAKSKKKKKESPSISKLRKIAKQPKQPNVFDDLKNMYK